MRKVLTFLLYIFFFFSLLVGTCFAAMQSENQSINNLNYELDYNSGYYQISGFYSGASFDVEYCDLDNDGWKDIVLATFMNQQNKVYWNNQDGTFTEADEFGISSSWSAECADFDNNGYQDVFIANYGGGFGGTSQNYVYYNNGDRTFTEVAKFGSGNSTNSYIEDYNNDGYIDVLVSNANTNSILYTNNGDDTYTTRNLGSANTMVMQLHDLDGDGDLDKLWGTYAGSNWYQINNGDWTFTNYVIATSTTVSDFAVFDYDKDSDLDFVVALNGQNKLYVNNGDGTWTPQNQFGVLGSNVAKILDLDNNGWEDVIIGNGPFGGSQQNYTFYNNGDGTFTQSAMWGVGSTYSIEIDDIDRDGDLDFFMANWNTNDNLFLTGYYSQSTNYSVNITPNSTVYEWEYIVVSEQIYAGNVINYAIYSGDSNSNGDCSDETLLISSHDPPGNVIDLSGITNQSICLYVSLSSPSNRSYTPTLKEINAFYLVNEGLIVDIVPNEVTVNDLLEMNINIHSYIEHKSGQRLVLTWEEGNGIFIENSCLTPTTDVNGINPGGGGVVTIQNNREYLYTFNEDTPAGDYNFCVKVNVYSIQGSYSITVNGSEGAGLLYVSEDNQVNILANIAPTLSFNIVDIDDTTDSNACNFGSVTTQTLPPNYDSIVDVGRGECGYALAVGTNAVDGFSTYLISDGALRNSNASITDITTGTSFSTGTEAYGLVNITVGQTGRSTTTGLYTESFTRVSPFTETISGMRMPTSTSELYRYDDGVQYVQGTDSLDITKVIHGIVVGAGTPAGMYQQVVTYTVVPRF